MSFPDTKCNLVKTSIKENNCFTSQLMIQRVISVGCSRIILTFIMLYSRFHADVSSTTLEILI